MDSDCKFFVCCLVIIALTIIAVAAIIGATNYYGWKVLVDGGYEQVVEPAGTSVVWRKRQTVAEK